MPNAKVTLAFGKQAPCENFPDVFVLASPSGAASGAWTLQPWLELAAHVLHHRLKAAKKLKKTLSSLFSLLRNRQTGVPCWVPRPARRHLQV